MTQPQPASESKPAASVNWDEVRQRLETAELALQQGDMPTPERKQKILFERAQALGRELQTDEAVHDTIEIIEFLLAHETYGVETRYIREVFPLRELTSIPCTPAFVLGLVNVRGQIISVIDLKKFFELPEKGITDLNKLIILESPEMVFGILADTIIRVHQVAAEALHPALPTLTGIREEFLKGITPEQVIVLDGDKLLTSQSLIVQDEVDA
jgi:purine-binding chemotaxis protein CheW